MSLQPDDPEGLLAEMMALRRFVALKVDSIGEGSGNIYEARDDVSTKLTNGLLTILSALIIAAVVGEVNLYAKVEAIQATMQLIVDGRIVIVKVP